MRPLLSVLWILLAGLCLAPPAAAAPVVRVQDPTTGTALDLRAGAPALHLVFFATWCPTCLDELPLLAELEARWSRQGYRLVIVAVRTRQDAARLAEFVGQQRPPGDLLFDSQGAAERQWKAQRLPAHVVLDSSGKEVARSNALDARIETAVERLLGESLSGPARGKP